MNEVEMSEEEAKHLKRNWSYELNVAEIVRGGGIIADPQAVAEDICRLRDDYGVNHVILAPWRGPDHASVMRSIESFARRRHAAGERRRARRFEWKQLLTAYFFSENLGGALSWV